MGRLDRTFYTGGGTRRHAIKEQDATAVWSFCGLVSLVKDATFSRRSRSTAPGVSDGWEATMEKPDGVAASGHS